MTVYNVFAYDSSDFDAMMAAEPIGQIESFNMLTAQSILRCLIADGLYPAHAVLLEA